MPVSATRPTRAARSEDGAQAPRSVKERPLRVANWHIQCRLRCNASWLGARALTIENLSSTLARATSLAGGWHPFCGQDVRNHSVRKRGTI